MSDTAKKRTGRAVDGRETEKPGRVCPWWLCYLFDNPLRRVAQPPEKMLAPYVTPGMRVLDIGCGLGHFALGMARLAGKSGTVVAVDVQPMALKILMRRARRAGVAGHVEPVLCAHGKLGVQGPFDFALCGNMLHETPDPQGGLSEIFQSLVPDGVLLLLEPSGHVTEELFEAEVEMALAVGFEETDRPVFSREFSAVFRRPVLET